jgi:hypothetical protein
VWEQLRWKGKGSTLHLVTEGHGLPLASLVTAANVAEVTVGLKVVDQVRVPVAKDDPSSVLPAWEPTRAMTVLHSDTNCGDGTFNLPYPTENCRSAVVDLAVLPKSMRPAEVAGRWSGAMAGWATGGGW